MADTEDKKLAQMCNIMRTPCMQKAKTTISSQTCLTRLHETTKRISEY